jgi:predicted dehydrogenase
VSNQQGQTDRRDFLKASTAAAGAALATGLFATGVHAAGNDEIKVGIIGTGGRGTQAGENVLDAAKNVTIVALGDAFQDRAEGATRRLQKYAGRQQVKNLGNKVDVNGRTYVGLDAYKKVLDTPGLNYVILATPPGFRPLHLQAAVEAGKHIFTEKPVAVDGPGIRKVFQAYQDAKKKNLAIAAGTQRRHQLAYQETMKKLHDGALGDLVGGCCYWNQNILWKVDREKDMTDLVWQMRNWYNFVWLCGDHIVEQHVHNIDVLNWALLAHPVKAVGMGYRTRTDPRYGHIYDFFSVDFEYPKGIHVHSMCRQISGCANSVSEFVQGAKGQCRLTDHEDRQFIDGKKVITKAQLAKARNPYVQEHMDLIESIRKGEPINELKNVAESTLSAILGRMSAYTGQAITWEQALASRQNTMPENLDWNMKLDVPPVPVPGKTKFS